jgi:hypothetical protein
MNTMIESRPLWRYDCVWPQLDSTISDQCIKWDYSIFYENKQYRGSLSPPT